MITRNSLMESVRAIEDDLSSIRARLPEVQIDHNGYVCVTVKFTNARNSDPEPSTYDEIVSKIRGTYPGATIMSYETQVLRPKFTDRVAAPYVERIEFRVADPAEIFLSE